MNRFRNKYRTQSHRMPGWDYSSDGMYFITLVTQNRKCILGEIINKKMILSGFGQIVADEWLKSFDLRNELFLDEYIIMPNHLHAIVIINQSIETNKTPIVETHSRVSLQQSTNDRESIQSQNDRVSLQQPNNRESIQSQNDRASTKLIRKPKSISSFIAGFKSNVNSRIDDYIDQYDLNIPKYNRNNHFFQPNYYDHIIRNNNSYNRIKNYIINNPFKWLDDKFHFQ